MQRFLIMLLFIIHFKHTLALEVVLYDEVTTKPLKEISVFLKIANSIQCVRAPCPSNERVYQKKTTNKGHLIIEELDVLNEVDRLTIVLDKYHPMSFKHLKKINEQKLYLTPLFITQDFRKIKFIDKVSGMALAYKEVWFSSQKNCFNKSCNGLLFEGKTNELGLVFFKFLDVFPQGLAQMDPVYLHMKGFWPHERHHHHQAEVKLILQE